METLTREHEAAAAAPEQTPEPAGDPAVAPRSCATCGATMAAGQDWCLECGAARPDRLAGAPTWRSGAAVLAVTGVLVAGAAAAAWAGLSADARRVAAPNPQASLPQAAPPAQTQPAPPAAPPPATAAPPAATQPPAPANKPNTSPPPAAKTPATPAAPATPAPTAQAPATPKTTTPPAAPRRTAKLVAIDLKPDAASTYNPYARPDNDFTDPKFTLDGDPATGWTASFSGNQSGAVGVDLTLDHAAAVRDLQVRTTTPGMTIEIYASRSSSEPVSIQDPGWDHLATQLDVGSNERIVLGEGTTKYRHVLVWPTEGPPDGDHVALNELKLYK